MNFSHWLELPRYMVRINGRLLAFALSKEKCSKIVSEREKEACTSVARYMWTKWHRPTRGLTVSIFNFNIACSDLRRFISKTFEIIDMDIMHSMQGNEIPKKEACHGRKSGNGAPAASSALVIRIRKIRVTILKRTQSDVKPHWNKCAFERRCSL